VDSTKRIHVSVVGHERGHENPHPVSPKNGETRVDWIRAKARSETGSLRLRTKASGKEGAFADDDYRV
jgi:hypothetical protein